MKKNVVCQSKAFFILCVLLCFGCTERMQHKIYVPPDPVLIFNQQIDQLIKTIKKNRQNQTYEHCSGVIYPESMFQSQFPTRLEEYLVNQIQTNVLLSHNTLSRKSWQKVLNGETLLEHPGTCIFKIHIDRSVHLKSIEIAVSLYQYEQETYPNLGNISLEYHPSSLAWKMDKAPSENNLYPIGHKNNPFHELELFAFGLSKDMLDCYKKTGIQLNNGNKVEKSDVILYFDTQSENHIPQKTKTIIGDALNMRFIQSGLFKSAIHRNDFRAALSKIFYYMKHGSGSKKIVDISRYKNLLFNTPTIFFMTDIIDMDTVYKVTTKAYWLVNPQKNRAYEIETINLAGTYVAEFFDYAYLKKNCIPQSNASQSEIVSKANSNFFIRYVHRPDAGAGYPVTLHNDAHLKSGDHYKIIFTPNKNCFVYIYQLDSKGKLTCLFPMKQWKNIILNNLNPVQKGMTYHLPSDQHYYILDNHTGKERFYCIVSEKRDNSLERLYDNLTRASHSQQSEKVDFYINQMLSNLKTRGLANIVPSKENRYSWKEQGNIFSIMDHHLENIGVNSMNILTINHQ